MMKMIPFTQFLRPNGRARQVTIEASGDTEEMARSLIEKGARFEIEVLMNGIIHMDCQIGDKLLANQLCENGPPVLEAVKELVLAAFEAGGS